MSRIEVGPYEATGQAWPPSCCGACSAELQIRIDERHCISQELHDSTSQLLVALQLKLLPLKERLWGTDNQAALVDLDSSIAALHRQIRMVSAIGSGSVLPSGPLPMALREMAANFGRLTEMQVKVQVSGEWLPQPIAAEVALYRIAQEALANARRHGQADSALIRLRSGRFGVAMTVRDNGIGIAPGAVDGIGLTGMRRRAGALGGRFSIRRHGLETRLTVALPSQTACASSVEPLAFSMERPQEACLGRACSLVGAP